MKNETLNFLVRTLTSSDDGIAPSNKMRVIALTFAAKIKYLNVDDLIRNAKTLEAFINGEDQKEAATANKSIGIDDRPKNSKAINNEEKYNSRPLPDGTVVLKTFDGHKDVPVKINKDGTKEIWGTIWKVWKGGKKGERRPKGSKVILGKVHTIIGLND